MSKGAEEFGRAIPHPDKLPAGRESLGSGSSAHHSPSSGIEGPRHGGPDDDGDDNARDDDDDEDDDQNQNLCDDDDKHDDDGDDDGDSR